MDFYDQQREDPEGFYLGLAIIAGTAAGCLFIAGGAMTPVGILAAAAALGLFWKSCQRA